MRIRLSPSSSVVLALCLAATAVAFQTPASVLRPHMNRVRSNKVLAQQQDQYYSQGQQYGFDQQPQQYGYDQQGQQYDYDQSYTQEAQQMYVQAASDFPAEQAGDLGFRAGNVIQVMQQGEQGGWWEGSLNGQVGWFPSSYCSAPFDPQQGQAEQQVESSSDEEVVKYISERLQEPQLRIVRAVVDYLGTATAYDLLDMTEQVQAQGGMIVPETGKLRTSGGIYLKLLKDAGNLPREAQEAALVRIKTEGRRVKSRDKGVVDVTKWP